MNPETKNDRPITHFPSGPPSDLHPYPGETEEIKREEEELQGLEGQRRKVGVWSEPRIKSQVTGLWYSSPSVSHKDIYSPINSLSNLNVDYVSLRIKREPQDPWVQIYFPTLLHNVESS